MKKFFSFLLSVLFFSSAEGMQEYVEPQEVATTEGLPSNLVNQSVCVISGEYTDSIVDVTLPGPEPLTISRLYTSFSNVKPWSFNHYDRLILGNILYYDTPAYVIVFRQTSGSQLDYIFEKKGDYLKIKKIPFKLIPPKGLTNGASMLSGKTNIKNQTLHFYRDEETIVAQSGAGNRKTFKKIEATHDGWPVCGQVSEEKVNGSRILYKGRGRGLSGASQIICENKETGQRYSSVTFKEKAIGKEMSLQTLMTSDGRTLSYFFKRHSYSVKEKEKNFQTSYCVERFYLSKVDHPYAPPEKYHYREKALSDDLHITAKLRDEGRRFVNIEYYHKGVNHLGGEIGWIDIKDKDDFRLDRVRKLKAPVGTDQTPITTHRFDYHAKIKQHKIKDYKKVAEGYTDVYDAQNHKTRYRYDEQHRLTSITRYTGTDTSTYSPYTQEHFLWDEEGCLIAKIFKDGEGNIHHARTFEYDSYGNVKTSTLCGKLTGRPSPPLLLNSKGRLIENGYERETKSYTYSDDGLNLLLTETDSNGKTIRYDYQKNSDRLKAKYLSYEGKIRLREFYFYDRNHALEKKILDDGNQISSKDLSSVTERHYTLITPRTQAPIGLPESVEERAYDFPTRDKTLLKRSTFLYSPEGRLLQQEVFDANGSSAYLLKWDYDLHGNLISETNALGISLNKIYDPATDNLIEQNTPDVTSLNSYDFANRLIKKEEIHPDQKFVTSQRFDYLGNCTSIIDPFGHETHSFFDDFGRVIEIHYPQIPKEGVLTTPIVKKSYDIAGFLISETNPNGETTSREVNIRGQPTQITYPDGTQEEMIYSLDGQLLKKIAKNGTQTEYLRDPLGRVIQETIFGADGIKKTHHSYNAFHLLESKDPEGHLTTYTYDSAGRLKEILKNDTKTEQFYDSLGRLCEIREYDGHEPHEYRATIRKYDNLNQLKEEYLQTADGKIHHSSRYEYDVRGNRILEQAGDQKTFTEYNTRNEPTKITDSLGHETHLEYHSHFINEYGQKVLQKKTTDPLGYQIIETYDTAHRIAEILRLNPLGEKIARKAHSYDLLGNPTKIEEEVIEEGKTLRMQTTLFSYNTASQITQITEAAGMPEQKITRFSYNAFGQKETLLKPDGNKIFYTYDTFERLKTQTSSDQSISYLYEYNLLDQVTTVTDQNSGQTTKREYSQGNLKKETLANGLSLEYTHDRTRRTRTITFPDQTGIEYVYNAVDLKEIHRLIQGKRTYTHYDLEHSLSGQITKTSLAGQNGIVNYSFDTIGHCVSIESATFHQHIPPNGFDAAGNLLKYQNQQIPYEFTYDDHYQIKSEKGHCEHTYTFDSLSNRTSKDQEKHQYNALNELIKKGEQKLFYDLNGNLIRNDSYAYSYDALNRLIKMTYKDRIITYTYDAFNRRLTKTTNEGEEQFLYQGQDEIGRWKKGICQEIRLIGKNPLNPTIALEINGTPYIPLHDIRSNIVTLRNLQGETMEHYRYTAYGETEILSPSGEKRKQSTIGNPWQYASKRIDEDTGWIAFGIRDYDPQLGRWTTPDPSGFTDGSNLYAYVHNNPLKYSDPSGLFIENLFGIGALYYNKCESNYQKFCTPLSFGQYCDPQFSPVFHINIEDKLEKDYDFRKKETDPLFHRTKTYSTNDFINPETNQNYQFKELPQNKKIIYMNGILNTFQDFQESLLHLSNMIGYNTEGVFCPTFGKTLDSLCYIHALKDYIAYEGSREMQEHIQKFHATSSPEATMLIIGHSRGCAYLRNTMIDTPQTARDKVEILAFAPGAYIDEKLCKSVLHYASTRDIVPKIDISGRRRCQDTIIMLEPHPQASIHDHDFCSPTFTFDQHLQLEKYIKK